MIDGGVIEENHSFVSRFLDNENISLMYEDIAVKLQPTQVCVAFLLSLIIKSVKVFSSVEDLGTCGSMERYGMV